jgi:hypothetical protein
MFIEFTSCDKEICQCFVLLHQLKEARDPSNWQPGNEFYSSEWIQDALDMQLHMCKRIKNPFYC